MKKYIVGLILISSFLISTPALAAGLSEVQIQAIVSLLSSFGADSSTVSNVSAVLHGQAVESATASTTPCLTLNNNLYADTTDATTDGEVSKLQQFLGGHVTGYFGPITLQLMQNWQAVHGIASSGSPDTTGYGYTGPKTRSAMSCAGSSISNANVATPSQSNNPHIQTATTTTSTPTPTNPSISGCTSGTKYNPMTGILCTDNAVNTPVISNPNNKNETSSGSSQSVGEQITVNISANPQEVKWGYGTMLTWVSKNATYCVPSGGPSESNWPNYSQNTSYSYYTGQLYKTTTYSLTCYNGAGQSGNYSITFNIDQPAGNASGSLSSDSTSCIVAENSNQCEVGLWWSIQNAAAPHLMNRNLGNALSNEANISNSNPLSVTVNYPQTTFDLKNGNDLLDTKTITASCATGTVWNMNLCRR